MTNPTLERVPLLCRIGLHTHTRLWMFNTVVKECLACGTKWVMSSHDGHGKVVKVRTVR